jgi:hypothetical protein
MQQLIPTLAVRMRTFAFLVLLFIPCASAFAQLHLGLNVKNRTDFLPAEYHHSNREPETGNRELFRDTLPKDTTKKAKPHSAKKASIMSACLPGLGQIYNRKYWKLGVIYPAMGGLIYGIAWNHKYFKVYRDALRIRYDGDSTTIDQYSIYSDDRIVTMKNYYQRYRDLCVIGFAAVYVLQVIDAAVDAHLFNFDVGTDLSMHWGPRLSTDQTGTVYGFGLHLSYR